MPRRSRFQSAGYVFHVLNRRAGAGQRLFSTESDYAAYLAVMQEARTVAPMRVLAYVLMPTHWHLLLWPEEDDQLSNYLHWLTATHTRRWHAVHETVGTGPLYQGRFKSFPVQDDEHFYTVCRYIERNPLRAGLVASAERWRWSSLWQRGNDRCDVELSQWPVPMSVGWTDYVNAVMTEAELEAVRLSVVKGIPFGEGEWRSTAARTLGLTGFARPRGRPARPF